MQTIVLSNWVYLIVNEVCHQYEPHHEKCLVSKFSKKNSSEIEFEFFTVNFLMRPELAFLSV